MNLDRFSQPMPSEYLLYCENCGELVSPSSAINYRLCPDCYEILREGDRI